MKFEKKERYNLKAYKGLVNKLMNDFELRQEFKKDIETIKENKRKTLLGT